ncbi:unnamed protein product [Trichobilharzia szidati]|nr:unnamed protein product [Trichobilharzia szidati]
MNMILLVLHILLTLLSNDCTAQPYPHNDEYMTVFDDEAEIPLIEDSHKIRPPNDETVDLHPSGQPHRFQRLGRRQIPIIIPQRFGKRVYGGMGL